MEGLCGWNLVVSIDADIAGGLLANWLELKDVSALDSAWCQRSTRQEFLNMLSAVATPLGTARGKDSDDYGLWVSKRGVRVDSVRIVNSGLSAECKCESYYTSFEFCGFESNIAELIETISVVARKCSGIVEVILTNMCVEVDVLKILLNSFPRLRTLRCARVASDSLPLLAAKSCNLTGLHFSAESLYLQDFVDAKIVQRLTELTVMRVKSYKGETFRENIFLQPFARCPALLGVTFHWIYVKDLITVMRHAPSLRHLEVTGTAVNLAGPAFFDAAATSVPHLQSLQIAKFTNIPPQNSISLAHTVEQAAVDMVLQLRSLRDLRLGGDHGLANKVARSYDLSKGAVNTAMRTLVLGRIFHYDCIGAIMQVCPRLKNVHVLQRLRPAAREALRGMQLHRLHCAAIELRHADLAHLRNLTHLELDFINPKDLTLGEIEEVLHSNQGITHLTLLFHHPICRDALLQVIARACPQLRQLHVNGFYNGTSLGPSESTLEELWRACPGLSDMGLSV